MPRYDDDDDDEGDDLDVGKRSRGRNSTAKSRLAGPAIGLMVVTGLHLLLICIGIPFQILGLIGRGAAVAAGDNPFMANPALGLGSNVIGLLVQGFILFGAFQMKNGSNYGISMAVAILSVIPCFCSSCAVLGIPFGIWALI